MKEKEDIEEALRGVIDPELGIDIVRLGLIRDIQCSSDEERLSHVHIVMTLTSPMCPFADILIEDVKDAVSLLGYGEPTLSLTFDPPWEASDDLRLLLGL